MTPSSLVLLSRADSVLDVNALCGSRLVRFAEIVVFLRHDLERAGIEIVPTFRTPHVTLSHASLTDLVARLLNCEHTTRPNPYHLAEEGDRS